MTCSTIAALAGAVTLSLTTPGHPPGDRDTLTLAPHETYAAQVCYLNSPSQLSLHGLHEITMGELTVTVGVEVGYAETITVRPPPGYWVWPVEDATQMIHDGEAAVFFIVAGIS
jgi:hypothetical protein